MNELAILNINGVECFEKDGTAYLKLETVARGLGFTRTAASGNEVIRWERVYGYLKELGVPTSGHEDSQLVGKDGFPEYIPENIFYRLAMKAKNEAAEAFQAKIADEVIPSIRKHGAYMTESTIDMVMKNPEIVYKMAETMLSERERRITAEKQLDEAKPKVDYYDAFVNPEDYLNLRTVAKELKIPEREFVDFLLSEKIFFRSKRGHLLPYNKQSNEGLFVVKDYSNGKYYAPQTLFTPNGKDYVRMRYLDRQKESGVESV